MIHPFRLTLFFTLAIVFTSQAVPLRGTVRDEHGEALPYVSIYLENTTYGVASNAKGDYNIELEPGKHRLVFRMLGFDTRVIEITMGSVPQRVDVVLSSTELELAGVTILSSGRDPAYAIIEEAQAVRKQYLNSLNGYSRDTYVKATSETLPLRWNRVDTAGQDSTRERMNFVESIGTTYYQRPGRYKEIKSAYRDLSEKSQITISLSFELEGPRQTGTINPYLFYLNAPDADFNFYENSLDIATLGDLPYQSPIGVGAMLAYRYTLEATFKEDDKYIHKILVEPKNKEGAAFKGHIFIVDKTWAISAVDLEINPGALRFFRYFKIFQQYKEAAPGVFVPTREEFFYHARDGQKLVMSNTLALHSEYEVNPDFPRRFFNNELRRIEDDAMEKDSAFWEEVRPITLKVEEQEYVSEQDSIQQYYTSDEYKLRQDSIYNSFSLLKLAITGFGHQNSFTGWQWNLNGLLMEMRPLMPGGYHHAISGGVQKEFRRGYRVGINGSVNYGPRNNDITGRLELRYRYLPKKLGEWYIGVGDNYSLLNNLASAENLLSRSNYISQTFVRVGHEMEFFNGFFADFQLYFENQKPITGLELAPWSEKLFGELNLPQDFDPYEQFIFEAKISYTPGMKYYIEPYKKVNIGSDFPTFNLHYRKGIPGILGSEIDFDFLELSVDHRLDLKFLGSLHYKGYAGRFLNDKSLRFIEHKWFQGTFPGLLITPLASAQLLGKSFNTKKAWFNVHAAHHFNGFLMNKIPLIKQLGLQTTVGGTLILLEENNFAHSEIFVGIDKPFNFFKQRVSLGVYGVFSLSTESAFDSAIRIGGNIYNPFTREWNW